MTDKRVGVRIDVGATGLENVGKLSAGLRDAGASTEEFDAKAAALAAELQKLAQQQTLIDSFKKQKQALADAEAAMQAAKTKASELGREISAIEEPTKKQQRAFETARKAAREAAEAYQAKQLALQNLRGGMRQAGVATDALAEAQRRVRSATEAAATAATRLTSGAADQLQGLRATAAAAKERAAADADAAASATQLATKGRAATAALDAHLAANRAVAPALTATAAAAKQATGQLDGVGNTLRNVASIGVAGILGSETAQMLRSVAETADAYANLGARVKLVTGEGAAFKSGMQGIADVALDTNSNLEATGTLFARIAETGRTMGLGQAQSLAITESINQAIQLSGASAAASDAAITQLIQGLQSGVVRGEEFNSIMEQAPRLATALADGLGVAKGELRGLADQGRLTSDVVIRALQSQAGALQKEFATLPATVGRAIENLSTKWKLFIGELNSTNGATASVAGGINALADNLEELAGIAGRAGTVLVAALAVQAVGALRGMALQMAATGGAAALLSKNLADIPKVVNITVAAVGFELAYQLGQVLYENSAAARKLGVSTVAFFAGLVSSLQLLKESAAAVFTSDTIDAALKRYQERMSTMRATFEQMWEEAEKSPEAVRLATDAARAEADKLAAAAANTAKVLTTAGTVGAAGLASTGTAAATASAAITGLAAAASSAGRELGILETPTAKQADALVRVALVSHQVAQTLQSELPAAIAKLNGPELEAFRVAMTQALAQAQDELQKFAAELGESGTAGAIALGRSRQAASLLQQVLVDVGLQAAKSLGVDVLTATDKVGAGFKAADAELSILIRSLPALQKAGVDTGAIVGQALANMIAGAKNQAEIDAIIDRAEALQRTGKITGAVLSGVFIDAKERARALREEAENATPGMAGLGEAARKAGVDVAQLTGGITRGGQESIRTITDLVDQVIKTGVSAERASPVLADAFDKRLQAAATKEELQLLVGVMNKARDAGFDMGGVITAELEKARKKAEQLNPELNRINEAIRKMGGVPIGERDPNVNPVPTLRPGGPGGIDPQAPDTTDEFGRTAYQRDLMSKQGGPVDNSYVFDLRRRLQQGGGFDASEVPAIENALRAAQQNARLAGSSSVPSLAGSADAAGWVTTLRQVLARAQGTSLGTGLSQTGTNATGSDPASAESAIGTRAAGRRIEVNLRLNGGSGVAIGVASDADAERLQSFFRQLELDAGRAA